MDNIYDREQRAKSKNDRDYLNQAGPILKDYHKKFYLKTKDPSLNNALKQEEAQRLIMENLGRNKEQAQKIIENFKRFGRTYTPGELAEIGLGNFENSWEQLGYQTGVSLGDTEATPRGSKVLSEKTGVSEGDPDKYQVGGVRIKTYTFEGLGGYLKHRQKVLEKTSYAKQLKKILSPEEYHNRLNAGRNKEIIRVLTTERNKAFREGKTIDPLVQEMLKGMTNPKHKHYVKGLTERDALAIRGKMSAHHLKRSQMTNGIRTNPAGPNTPNTCLLYTSPSPRDS